VLSWSEEGAMEANVFYSEIISILLKTQWSSCHRL